MFIERPQFYAFRVNSANAAGTIQEGLSLITDLDAPFRLSGISIWTNNSAGGAFDGQISLRFQRPDGRLTQRIVTPGSVIASGNQYAGAAGIGANPNQALITAVTPNIIYPPGSTITIDLQTLSAAAVTPGSIVVFVGTKLFKSDDVWAPKYPPKFIARPYLNSLFVPNVSIANGPVLNQPFTVEQDADFVFQLGGYSDMSPGGNAASALFVSEAGGLSATAVTPGVAGNLISILFTTLGANQPVSASVVGNAITVGLATDAGGHLIDNPTGALVTTLNAIPALAALVTLVNLNNPFAPFETFPLTFLGGGTGGGSAMNLPDLGFQMRDWRLKSYMNDYIPVSLVFPFLTAQQPGWVFPEIYVPSQQQMFFDFNYLWPNPSTPAQVNVTLGLKGMKVYSQPV